MRTKMGRHYSADPRVPGSLPIYEPENLTDYQLCYWGVLDSYARQLQAESIYKKEKGKFYWVTTHDFHDFEKAIEIGNFFGLKVSDLELAKEHHQKVISLHHNPNKAKARSAVSVTFQEEEADVLNRVAFLDPQFVEKAISSPFVEPEIRNLFSQ